MKILANPLVLAWAGTVLLNGCASPGAGKPQPASDAPPADAAKKSSEEDLGPKIPGMDAAEAPRAQVLVREVERVVADRYVQETAMPSGTVRGICVLAKPPAKESGAQAPDWAKAIRQPEAKEVDYYRNANPPDRPAYWREHKGRCYVLNAALMLKGIRSGPRASLARCGYTAHQGILRMADGGKDNILGFGPVGERVFFGTWDYHPCEIELCAEKGTTCFEGNVRAYSGFEGKNWNVQAPEMTMTEPLRAPGAYLIACKRHAWQKGFYLAVDNPYAVHSAERDIGRFELRDVPVGTHPLVAWHPIFKIIKDRIEVKVEEDKTTEIVIEFEGSAKR